MEFFSLCHLTFCCQDYAGFVQWVAKLQVFYLYYNGLSGIWIFSWLKICKESKQFLELGLILNILLNSFRIHYSIKFSYLFGTILVVIIFLENYPSCCNFQIYKHRIIFLIQPFKIYLGVMLVFFPVFLSLGFIFSFCYIFISSSCNSNLMLVFINY